MVFNKYTDAHGSQRCGLQYTECNQQSVHGCYIKWNVARARYTNKSFSKALFQRKNEEKMKSFIDFLCVLCIVYSEYNDLFE